MAKVSGRRVLQLVAVAVAVSVIGWTGLTRPWQPDADATARVRPQDPAVVAAEQVRREPDAVVRDVALTAAPKTVRLGTRSVQTWAFNGTLPGPEIRVRAGDVLRARVDNSLPAPLTVHWHGIALRADMDGVPDLTQKAIPTGGTFTYEFTLPDPGTYFYHSHSGTQLDRGLYGALVVEPRTTAASMQDVPVLLDDWLDDTGTDPDQQLATLKSGGMGGMEGMEGMDMSAATPEAPLGADTGDVDYPLYLVNGQPATAPREIAVRPGEQVRLRLMNAGADTPFRVAVGGNRLTVVATDGFDVQPVTVDAVLLGMGERYDVIVTVPKTGAVAVVARAEGKNGQALAVLRASAGPAPAADAQPAGLTGRLLTLADLRPAPGTTLAPRRPDRTYRTELTGNMNDYRWGIKVPSTNGVTLPVRQGERIRLVLRNTTMMWHPMHLHGHTFQVVAPNGAPGPRKDTVVVAAGATITVEFDADNPGQWAFHCHNTYHGESGMITTLSYVR